MLDLSGVLAPKEGRDIETIVRPSPMAGRFFGLAVRPLNTKKVSDASS